MSVRSDKYSVIGGSALGVAAALFLMLRLQTPDSSPAGKASSPANDYRLRWVTASGQEKDVIEASEITQHRLRLWFNKSLTLGVYGSIANSKGVKDLLPVFASSGAGQKDLDIPIESLDGIDRLCAVGAPNEEEFAKVRGLLESVWPLLNTEQCVSIHL